MNIALALDFETTGTDSKKDEIIEIGAVFWDVQEKAVIATYSQLCWDNLYYPNIHPDALALSELSQETVELFGVKPGEAFCKLSDLIALYKPFCIIAHNGNSFDKLFLEQAIEDGNAIDGYDLPWLDTRHDLPYPDHIETRKLGYLALEHGIMNPFPHRALFDVMTMLKIVACYEWSAIEAYRAIPSIFVAADVSYNDKDKAKALKFSWEKIGDQTFPKTWVKQIKQDKLEDLRAKAEFAVRVIK